MGRDLTLVRGVGTAADHQMNALGLAGVVVVQQELRFLCEKRLAVLGVAVLGPACGADYLLGRDAVNSLE